MKYRIVRLEVPKASIKYIFNVQKRTWLRKWSTIYTAYTENQAKEFLHTYLWDNHSYMDIPGQVIEQIEI